MFDVTGRGDKSFNDAAAAGLDQAVAEFGDAIVPTESPPQSADDRAERVAAAAEAGNQLVIATGFLWLDTITQASAAYPDTHFLLIDAVVEADNVHNIVFAEEQGSFLVGVAAALQSESGQLGFVGGIPNELIKKFEAGFVAGAECVNPDAEVLVEYVSDDPTDRLQRPGAGQGNRRSDVRGRRRCRVLRPRALPATECSRRPPRQANRARRGRSGSTATFTGRSTPTSSRMY